MRNIYKNKRAWDQLLQIERNERQIQVHRSTNIHMIPKRVDHPFNMARHQGHLQFHLAFFPTLLNISAPSYGRKTSYQTTVLQTFSPSHSLPTFLSPHSTSIPLCRSLHSSLLHPSASTYYLVANSVLCLTATHIKTNKKQLTTT